MHMSEIEGECRPEQAREPTVAAQSDTGTPTTATGCATPASDSGPNRVVAVAAGPGFWLTITFADGREILADFAEVVRGGGVFRPLQDEKLFARVTAPLPGLRIEWPEPRDERGNPLISIDAGSIYRTFDEEVAGNHPRRPA